MLPRIRGFGPVPVGGGGLREEPEEPAEAAPVAEAPAPVVPFRKRAETVPAAALPAPVVPLPGEKSGVVRWALPLAAMLLIGLMTVPLYFALSRDAADGLRRARRSGCAGESAARRLLVDHARRPRSRDFGPHPFEFLAGAHLVDLRLTLARDDADGAVD